MLTKYFFFQSNAMKERKEFYEDHWDYTNSLLCTRKQPKN